MIERAEAVHAPVMAAIHSLSFSPPAAWDAATIAQQLQLPGSFGLIGDGGFLLARVVGGAPLGVAGEAEILTLAVIPERRRQGLARLLLHAAMAHAASSGATAMFLEVAEANLPARALYEAVGAEKVGHRRAYYPDGRNALVLRISQPALLLAYQQARDPICAGLPSNHRMA